MKTERVNCSSNSTDTKNRYFDNGLGLGLIIYLWRDYMGSGSRINEFQGVQYPISGFISH